MDEEIIKEYNSFKTSFEQKLKNIPITVANFCYLIKEEWDNKIFNLINSINNNQLKTNKDKNIFLKLKNEQPEFIDDISSVLDCLNNKIRIKFMGIKLVELIYNKKILKNHNKISYYTGNNKIIIEYEEKQDNALLIENPLENISKVWLISTLNKLNFINEKNRLYQELLNKEQLNIDKIYKKFNQIFINLKDFSDIYSNSVINKNTEDNYNKKRKDVRYNKDTKKNLNKSMDFISSEFSTNKILMEKNIISTAPNYNKINKKNNINQLDFKKDIEKHDKISQIFLIDKNKNSNKFNYEDKTKKFDSNELQNINNIIKFDINKLVIGQNNNFTLLSNKNGENKKNETKIITIGEANNLELKIKSLNEEIEKLKKIINEKNKELEELKNEKKKINKDFNRIKEEYNKLKEKNDESNLKPQKFIKLNPIKQTRSHNRSSSMPRKESQFYNEPIKLYEYPTLIGLNNIGATCFMNSTLQCLSQTEALTNYFLKDQNLHRIMNNNLAKKNERPQLSPIFLELIKRLWSKEKIISFSPNNFMNTVEKMNPIFKTGQAGDAKDFIIFILEQIHKELKQPICTYNNNFNFIQPLNQYDKNNALYYFMNEFKKECSIISDVFFGFNETTNICINCKNIYNSNGLNNPICYNYGIFNCLIFPLEEVKNMRNKQMNFNNNSNCVSLYECFCYNNKSEYFTGENRNYCNICKQLFDSIYTSQIFVSPTILIIILNRGKGNIYDVKLNFTESIDITKFVLQREKPQIIYNLYGVITLIGQNSPNGHFVASCKSPVDYRWYRFNDSIVNPINNLQKEVIEFGTPYILFYQKQN